MVGAWELYADNYMPNIGNDYGAAPIAATKIAERRRVDRAREGELLCRVASDGCRELAVHPGGGGWPRRGVTPDALGGEEGGHARQELPVLPREALPKKETYKPENLNERGKFLLKDMQDRKLKAADMDKLKDFPGGKEQK